MAWYNLYALAFRIKFSWLHNIGILDPTISEETSLFMNCNFWSLDPREFQDTIQTWPACWLESEPSEALPSSPSPALTLGSWLFHQCCEHVQDVQTLLAHLLLLPAGWIPWLLVSLLPPALATTSLPSSILQSASCLGGLAGP